MLDEIEFNKDVTTTNNIINTGMKLFELFGRTGLVSFAKILPNGLNVSSCFVETNRNKSITIYIFAK